MANFIALLVLALCLGAAIRYIVRQKKRGAKCIGCPYGESCAAKREGGCEGQGPLR